MDSPKNKTAAGFTIVEILLVLAVAGLIFLIVFEVVPSLERSSRNNQRRQDVNVILDAVSQYELKDSGNFPLACGGGGPACNQPYCMSTPCTDPNDYFLQYAFSSLTYYTTPGVVQLIPQTAGTKLSPITFTTIVAVYDFEICDSNGDGGATGYGADYSDVVALYALEQGNGAGVPQCQNL